MVVCEVPEARLSVKDKTTDSDEVYFNSKVHIYTKISWQVYDHLPSRGGLRDWTISIQNCVRFFYSSIICEIIRDDMQCDQMSSLFFNIWRFTSKQFTQSSFKSLRSGEISQKLVTLFSICDQPIPRLHSKDVFAIQNMSIIFSTFCIN